MFIIFSIFKKEKIDFNSGIFDTSTVKDKNYLSMKR